MNPSINNERFVGAYTAYTFDFDDLGLYLEIDDAEREFCGTLYVEGDEWNICEFPIQKDGLPRYAIDVWMLLISFSHGVIGGLWK